jgi:PAS domain S-box-containing protein
MLADDKEILIMKTIAASELRRAPYILITIFIILAAGIITAGYLYHQHYKENYRVEVERRLSAIAELKVNELVRWRNERLSDAGIFYKNAAFSALVQRLFETPDDVEAQGQIRTWLSQVQAAYEYDRIILLDAQGVERVSVPDTSESSDPHPPGDIVEVLRSREVTFLDFHRHAPDSPICLGVLVPILDGQDENRAIGTVALRINPTTYLYPFINQWPIPSRTAETLIVRREGNEAVFLNELKFQKNTALNLRFPLEEKNELPAVKAALGQEGIVEGIDYRGVPVIAAVRAVPDSPWFLVARMDTEEAYGPLRRELRASIVFVGTLLMAAGASVGFIWKRQSAYFYRRQSETAGALRESEAKYRTLLEHLPQKVFLKDRNSVYICCNENYAKDLGISSEQLPGKTDYDLFPAALAEKYRTDDKRIMESGQVSEIEEPYLCGEGQMTVHTVKVPIPDEEGNVTGVLGIFWDVTESKRAEDAIKESEERFRAIFDCANDGILLADEEAKTFCIGNNAICQMLGYTLEEIKHLGVSDIHPKGDLPYVIEQFEAQVRGEVAVTKDLPVKRKDGSVFYADVNSSLVTLAGRRYLLGLFRDVTERNRAEEGLKEAKAFTESTLNSITDIFYSFDLSGKFLNWNHYCPVEVN